MTGLQASVAGRLITRTTLFGLISLALYFLLYFFEDSILAFTTRGGWYFVAPVVIAFVFSYVHGNFTAYFWDILGIKAKK